MRFLLHVKILFCIKEQSLKTTEIYYSHISNRDLSRIKSPLDSLKIKGGDVRNEKYN